MEHVRKLTNISNASIPVEVDSNTKLYVAPGGVVENKKVYNLNDIRPFCKIEEDLGEVNKVCEGIQKLYD